MTAMDALQVGGRLAPQQSLAAGSALRVILIFDYASITGGAAKSALESAMGLARRGHHVTLFSAVGPVWPKLAEAGVEVICLDQFDHLNDPNRVRSAISGLWNWRAAGELRRLLRAADPARTIIHVHEWAKALSPSVGLEIVRSGLPTIYSLHEYFLACPNGTFFDFGEGRNCGRTPLSAACVTRNCDQRNYAHKVWRVARHVALRATPNFASHMRHYIYLADLQLEVLRPHLTPGARFFKVANPIDIERRPRIDVGGNATFLYVGRLSREKGVDMLAKAARSLNLPVRFIGDGPERENIRRILPDADISGWLPPDAVAAAMASARALLFPSLWYEGKPMVTLEAAARGLPAVISDNTSARESIVHNETGLLFRNGDQAALESAIAMLDPATADRLGRAAYEGYWLAPQTLDLHVRDLEQVYAEVRADYRATARTTGAEHAA